eukprot:contig_12873_g3068
MGILPRPFTCNKCGKKLRKKEHLKRHVQLIHERRRPYGCAICVVAFGTKQNLQTHLMTKVHSRRAAAAAEEEMGGGGGGGGAGGGDSGGGGGAVPSPLPAWVIIRRSARAGAPEARIKVRPLRMLANGDVVVRRKAADGGYEEQLVRRHRVVYVGPVEDGGVKAP